MQRCVEHSRRRLAGAKALGQGELGFCEEWKQSCLVQSAVDRQRASVRQVRRSPRGQILETVAQRTGSGQYSTHSEKSLGSFKPRDPLVHGMYSKRSLAVL